MTSELYIYKDLNILIDGFYILIQDDNLVWSVVNDFNIKSN